MSFDIARAVAETFGSRTPLLDRVLSYLFFADVAVIEQSTADSWGSGVTVIGLKGDADLRPGVVLAGALPTLRIFPETPALMAEAAGHPRDLYRLVDLMARVFALSVLDPQALRARLALVAYRPDPVAEALRDLPASPFMSGMDWLLSSPEGLALAPLSSSPSLVEVHLASDSHRGGRRRVRDVVSVRARTPRHDPAFPCRVLTDLRDLAARGHAEVLDLEPCAGSDLLAPSRVDAVLGVIREPLQLPEPWETLPDTRSTVRIGTWSDVLAGVLDLARGLEEEVAAASAGVGSPAPRTPIRLVALRGSSDDCSVFFAVDLPHPTLFEPFREQVETIVTAIRTPTLTATTRSVRASGPVLPGEGRVFTMGPSEDQVAEDPAAAARLAADAYVEAVSRWVRERS